MSQGARDPPDEYEASPGMVAAMEGMLAAERREARIKELIKEKQAELDAAVIFKSFN